MIRENLIVLINSLASSDRKKFVEFSERTGVSRDALKQFYNGNQNLNNVQLDQILSAFPEYKVWIATGLTFPEKGHISPEITETTCVYRQTGAATD